MPLVPHRPLFRKKNEAPARGREKENQKNFHTDARARHREERLSNNECKGNKMTRHGTECFVHWLKVQSTAFWPGLEC